MTEEEDEIHPCNLTDDRKCQCKAGTFLERNAPEHCQKCSTGCPSGMVQGSPCTPWSDLICGSPEAEGSQVKRILLPANDADPTETLQSFFDDIIKIVPFHSWNKVMRHMGLTDFEITIATESATSLEDKPYNMLKKWLQKRGRKASVNTLLDALEAREERNAKEKIQDLLVGSGKYTYAENRADRL
ncbi:tumor necrosis factor receptor superfamily member 10A-like [Rhynchocyon petersi]